MLPARVLKGHNMHNRILAALVAAATGIALLAAPAAAVDYRTLTLETAGSGLKQSDLDRIRETAAAAAKNSQNSLAGGIERYGKTAENIKRRVDDIADKALAVDRDAALRLIGIDPDSDSALYYFVSFSMPEDMLRAYVLDAMWTGGTLVFKGVPPNRDLKDFLVEDLRNLIYGKGAHAAIALDPRLFDAFQVKSAPTVVLSLDRRNLTCAGGQVSFKYKKQPLAYKTCQPQDPNSYWKMSGAVTSYYALTEFKKAGAGAAADTRLASLAKGSSGRAQPRGQAPFKGDWQEALTPEQILAGKKAIDDLQKNGQKPR